MKNAAWWSSVLAAVTASAPVIGQEYPAKPIRFIVTYPPGAASDTLARIIGQKLTDSWHQQVVVDNRAGGNTLIGTEMGAKSAADGYTLFMGQVQNMAIVPQLYKKLPVRHAQRFCAGDIHRIRASHPGRESRTAGQVGERADRACKIETRAAQVFIFGQRRLNAPRR